MRSKIKPVTCCLIILLFSPGLAAERLFDAHMHYDAEDAAHYTPQQIIRMLDQNNIGRTAVTSSPPQHAGQLYRQAPERIVPILGAYRNADDKRNWPHDTDLPARIEAELAKGGWRGIGELHLFADNRHSPVFRRIIELAQKHQLPLLLHADPAVIDTLYEIAPEQRVIWAHAGTFPYPDLIADYLRRYPPLSVDLSVRDDRIAPRGDLRDEWFELFVTHPDRFMIGIDTYSLSRWQEYPKIAGKIREWTRQLPEEVASRLTYENAAEAFNPEMQGSDATTLTPTSLPRHD
jgi:predicted TIM-barrel fold metal-dependent hydrolase